MGEAVDAGAATGSVFDAAVDDDAAKADDELAAAAAADESARAGPVELDEDDERRAAGASATAPCATGCMMESMSLTSLAPPAPAPPGTTASMQPPMHCDVPVTDALPTQGSMHVRPATYVAVVATVEALLPEGMSGVSSADSSDSGSVTDWPNEVSVRPPVAGAGLLVMLTWPLLSEDRPASSGVEM